jgi:hypothetical protein
MLLLVIIPSIKALGFEQQLISKVLDDTIKKKWLIPG